MAVRTAGRRRGLDPVLEASQETLSRTFDGLDDAVLIVEPQSRTILDCNPAAERMFGYRRAEMIGRNTRILHRDEESCQELDRRRRSQELEESKELLEDRPVPRVLATAEPIQGAEVLFRRRDGLELRLSVNAAPVESSDGGRHGVVVTYRDVTEKRAAAEAPEHSEALIVQAQKMEAIGRLAGGVAHDFNNLLTAILGYCDLAAARFRQGADAEAEIGGIRRAAARAAELTAQLLAFSRQQVREPRVLDPSRVLEELAGMLRVLVGGDVALELDLTPEPLRVTIDSGQLEQVVLNLAVNARDAMPRGGRLLLETRLATLREPLPAVDCEIPPGDFAVLAVADAGEGIPPENRSRIFEPFFTTKPAGHGTGLGLSTVYGTVTQNEGFVRVESELGAGARFEIYLPVTLAEAAAPRPGPETGQPSLEPDNDRSAGCR